MTRPIKPLDTFELQCVLQYLGGTVGITSAFVSAELVAAADEQRLLDRVTRFVLSHPDVTPDLARVFKRAVREGT